MDDKPITIKHIAKILNVSVSTVSRALHKHPSIGTTTRLKVEALASELNYEPNQTAIFFQKGKTFTIGVILPELSEAFFSTAISAIEDTAYRRNYTVLLAQSHDNEEKEKQLVEKMKKHRVDGLLVSVSKTTKNFEHFELLKRSNIPVVFFDRIPPIQNIHSVECDMEIGTMDAVSFLLQKGHRSIGLINGPSALSASGERKEGYIKAITRNRLKYDPTLVVSCDLTEEGTKIALDQLLANKRNPTAIVTFNDYVALYAIKHARHLNINLDKDLQFVSYANLPIINYMDHIPVASVEQFPYLQGQKATDILLDLLSSKKQVAGDLQGYYKIIVASQLVENHKK